ncbi:MAG: glycoside hydrolase family 11 protein [Spirochaetales bacterium]|nr:glycoside hydrolase family 11 protein [Spirochaetales bacterium]
MKKITVILFSLVGLLLSCSLKPGTIVSNQTGTDDGYFYSFWTTGVGSVVMNLDGGSGYTLTWSNVGNFVVGKGHNPCNSTNLVWTGSATGAQYFGVYGWLSSPLVEYYIGRDVGGGTVGTYSISAHSYTLKTFNCNGPNITGNGAFEQFNCAGDGSSPINLGDHFAEWEILGETVTTQNYCIVATEGWGGSSGSSSVTLQ